jgi:hypothetical protein
VIHRKRIFNLLLNALSRIYGSENENESLIKIFKVQNLDIECYLVLKTIVEKYKLLDKCIIKFLKFFLNLFVVFFNLFIFE